MPIDRTWLDRLKPQGPPDENAPDPSVLSKLAWFMGLSLISVTVVAIIAYTLRGLLFL